MHLEPIVRRYAVLVDAGVARLPVDDGVDKGDGDAHPDLPWKCSDGGTIRCQGTRCCAWSPELGWACM